MNRHIPDWLVIGAEVIYTGNRRPEQRAHIHEIYGRNDHVERVLLFFPDTGGPRRWALINEIRPYGGLPPAFRNRLNPKD